jgi:hypothetical protein
MTKVKITSDGTGRNTSVVDAETGQPIPLCYAYQFSGSRMNAVDKAVLWCHMPEVEITAQAEVVEVPRGLKDRAVAVAKQFNNDAVNKALAELLGVSVTPASGD